MHANNQWILFQMGENNLKYLIQQLDFIFLFILRLEGENFFQVSLIPKVFPFQLV